MTMKKNAMVTLLALAAAGGAWAQANDTLAKIKSGGSATLGVRESSGLGFTLGGGKYVGFNTEMGERIIATPVPAADRLFLRGDKHLFCIAGPAK